MKEIKKGFECAIKHHLTLKEMEILISFMEGPKSTTQITKEKESHFNTIYALTARLKLKGLIIEDHKVGQQIFYKINLE